MLKSAQARIMADSRGGKRRVSPFEPAWKMREAVMEVFAAAVGYVQLQQGMADMLIEESVSIFVGESVIDAAIDGSSSAGIISSSSSSSHPTAAAIQLYNNPPANSNRSTAAKSLFAVLQQANPDAMYIALQIYGYHGTRLPAVPTTIPIPGGFKFAKFVG